MVNARIYRQNLGFTDIRAFTGTYICVCVCACARARVCVCVGYMRHSVNPKATNTSQFPPMTLVYRAMEQMLHHCDRYFIH
jgi:hypothetical protein